MGFCGRGRGGRQRNRNSETEQQQYIVSLGRQWKYMAGWVKIRGIRFVPPFSNVIYSYFSMWTYTLCGIIRKGISSRSLKDPCQLRLRKFQHITQCYVMHGKFIIFGDNFLMTSSNSTIFGRQLSSLSTHMLAKFHRPTNTARNVRASYFPHYAIQRILEGAIRIRPNHLVRISRGGWG